MEQKQAAVTNDAAINTASANVARWPPVQESAFHETPFQFLRTLHGSIGNRSTGRWLQAKLKVGPANDEYEQEADRVADQVMRMPETSVQRKCAGCESGGEACSECEKEELVQRKPAGDTHSAPAAERPLSAGGTAMPRATRDYFESRMGHDFSSVRLHTDAEAARSASAFAARAYTFGGNIVFATGEYAPGTQEGDRLLAHELTHVVQQRHAQGPGCPIIQRMPACPAQLADDDPVPSGWQQYHGDTTWFHCGFRVILEDRDPTPADPQQECAYDHSGRLVDENHPYAGCRGTPNQYDAAKHPFLHTVIDTGGIAQAGGPAFVTSRLYTLDRAIATAIEVVTTAGRIIRSVLDGFGRLVALGVLAASASVDPGNWRFQGLPARSIRHLNVMGAILGSAALSQNMDTLLRNLTRRLDSFAIAGLLDDLAQDINQALQDKGSTTRLTSASLGELSLLQLVEWLRVQGLLQYVRPPEDIAREQLDALSPANAPPSP